MASRNAAIAEAVKTALNTAAATPTAFGVTFVAKRVYVPLNDIKALGDLTVTVFAGGEEREEAGHGGEAIRDIAVEVGIEKKLPPTAANPSLEAANTTIDALMVVVERIADFFSPGELGSTGAGWVGTEMTGPDPTTLKDFGVFLAIVTFTFKLYE